MEGLCTGSSDEEIRILKDGETDERCFPRALFPSYSIVGGGTTGGYSGLKVFICKNPAINCAGRCKMTSGNATILDMGCEVGKTKPEFKCDFGCIGAMEVIPSQVQKVLFEGMLVDRNKSRNYLDEAKKEIKKDVNSLKNEKKGNQKNEKDS